MSANIDPSDNPLHSIATEFVTEEFETEIRDTDIEHLAEKIKEIVSTLRERINSDDQLETLIRSEPGGEVLMERHSVHRSDPEPLTQDEIIEPLFEEVGYSYLAPEAGDLSDERGEQADYSVTLTDYDTIESNRLLIEAEPLNKKLDQRQHGIGQVKSWLGQRKFEADFGIATDGIRWALIKYDQNTYSYDILAEVSLQPVFISAFENLTGHRMSLDEWMDNTTADILTEFLRVFEYKNFLSIAGEADAVIRQKQESITDEFYEEYIQRVFGIIDEDSDGMDTERCLVGNGVIAPHDATDEERRLFSVNLMNRLVFIKFLEDAGIVNETLLRDLKAAHDDGAHPGNFYKTFITPLIYDVFNKRPNYRPDHAQRNENYQNIPYLNGGLFRENIRKEREYNVRDSILLSIIDFLERYRFSTTGKPDDLDPSILGNVFEKTINYLAGDTGAQKEVGAYYTPDDITRFCAEKTVHPVLFDRFKTVLVEERGWPEYEVDNYDDVYDLVDTLPESTDVVDDLLNDLDQFRVLDPACGSGHFLTSVLGEILEIRKELYGPHEESPHDYKLKKQTVLENLYGVDIVGPGVEITKLRLWLSIISELSEEDLYEMEESEIALPNVAFNIRKGNSLIGYTETNRLRNDDVDSYHLDDFGTDSIENLIRERQQRINEYKQAYGDDAQRIEEGIAEQDPVYNSRLNQKLLDDLKNSGISFEYQLEDVQQPDLPVDSIHKAAISFAEPLNDDDKEDLDDQFRDAKGLRINSGSGGYVSITMSHTYLSRTPENRIQSIIDAVGADRISSMTVERYLTDDDLAEEHYLHWPMEFYEVFEEQGGFDIVIGNPPYGIDLSDTESELVDYPDTIHSSVVFTTRAEYLVRDNGKIAFVVPKPLTYAHRWTNAREYLLEKDLEYLIDLEKAFEGVDQEQMILTFAVSDADDAVTVGRREEDEDQFFEKEYSQQSLSDECFYMWVDEENEELVDRLQTYNRFNDADYAEATKGIDYFKDYITDKGGLLGYRGDDVTQFRFTDSTRFDESIKDRSDVDPADHEQKKVVFQRILSHVKTPVPRLIIMAAVDYQKAYIADTAIYAVIDDRPTEYLCGLLNSSLFAWYAYNLIYNRAIRSMDFTPIYFDKLPAPPEDDENLISRIAELTKEISEMDEGDGEELLERYELLNEAVYELYQIDEEKQALIDSEMPPRESTLLKWGSASLLADSD